MITFDRGSVYQSDWSHNEACPNLFLICGYLSDFQLSIVDHFTFSISWTSYNVIKVTGDAS